MKRLLLPIAALFLGVLPACPAAAHPLDVYLQAAYLTPAPATITLDLDVSPGVLVAPSALNDLDKDHDTQITQTEARAYADRIFQHVQLRADNRALPLTLTAIDVPAYMVLQAGYGKVRIHAQAAGAPTTVGSHELFFRNDHAPRGSAYQVNAVLGTTSAVTLGAQHRDATQQQSRIEYRIDAAHTAAPAPADDPEQTNRLADILQSAPLSLTAVLLALGFAALLGALHALTPGHAKTLMAAYLIGSGGTIRNALTLGAVITFTHTASVIVIGLIALFASSFLVPGLLVLALELLSGLLVLAIGLRLIRHRWPRRVHQAAAVHQPSRALVLVGADHVHHHVHSHGGRAHTHTLPTGDITARGLVAVGVSGGLGTSRQGAPIRIRQRMPSMSWRFFHFGGRPMLTELPAADKALVADNADQFTRLRRLADGEREYLQGVIEFYQSILTILATTVAQTQNEKVLHHAFKRRGWL